MLPCTQISDTRAESQGARFADDRIAPRVIDGGRGRSIANETPASDGVTTTERPSPCMTQAESYATRSARTWCPARR